MWLLLRGLARETGHWGNFPQLLGERIGQLPLCKDLPGCGERSTERAPASITGLLAQVRQPLDPREKKILVGVSLGGMVALQWAYEYPDEVAGVVIINSSARNLSRPFERFSPSAIRVLMQALTSNAAEREDVILRLVCNSESVWRRYLPTFQALAKHRPVTFGNAMRQLFAATQFRIQKVSPPGLVIVSDMDKLASPACSRTIAKFQGWPVATHPTAGHDLALEDPAWLVDQLLSWSETQEF